MRAIKTAAVITGIRSKLDKSAGLSISTPELTPEEFTAVRELQGINIDMVISPRDVSESGIVDVEKKSKKGRSLSQRLRDAYFVLWERTVPYQINEPESFDNFYARMMEGHIVDVQRKLDGHE